MNTQPLGKLFDVSRLTLGGGGIGQVWGSTTRAEALATVHAARDGGITLFDMAPLYGNGEAERVLGEAFAGGYPDDVRVTTKCMLGAAPPDEVEARLTQSLQDSLKRLGRDHVDIFILHGYVVPDGWSGALRPQMLADIGVPWSTWIGQVVPAFEKLKAAGTIRGWGITAASLQQMNLDALQAATPPDVVQCISNLLDSPGSMAITPETPAPRAVIQAARQRGVGVMGIRAVAAGALTERIDRSVKPQSREQRDYERAAAIRGIAADIGLSTADLAHRYALAMAGVDTVVLGVKNRTELAECLAAEAAPPLSLDLIARIDAAVADVPA